MRLKVATLYINELERGEEKMDPFKQKKILETFSQEITYIPVENKSLETFAEEQK